LVPAANGEPTTLRLSLAVTEFARRIKHQLSDAGAVEDYLMPSAPAYRLDRTALAELAAPVLDRTVACCTDLLDQLGVRLEEVTTILLVGGGARMPAVANTLARELRRPLRRVDEPDLATVRGAARWLLRTGPRRLPALAAERRMVPLSFAVPGGAATLQRWLVKPGQAYVLGQPLGRIRLPDGALWDLTAAAPGALDRTLVSPGGEIAAGQWLALALV
jgi:molecular chaperone DnaK